MDCEGLARRLGKMIDEELDGFHPRGHAYAALFRLKTAVEQEIIDQKQIDRKRAEFILRAQVAKFPGVTVEQIMSTARHRPIFLARAVAMAKIRSELAWSLPKIGRFFNRDHTSVLHSIKRAADQFPEMFPEYHQKAAA